MKPGENERRFTLPYYPGDRRHPTPAYRRRLERRDDVEKGMYHLLRVRQRRQYQIRIWERNRRKRNGK